MTKNLWYDNMLEYLLLKEHIQKRSKTSKTEHRYRLNIVIDKYCLVTNVQGNLIQELKCQTPLVLTHQNKSDNQYRLASLT